MRGDATLQDMLLALQAEINYIKDKNFSLEQELEAFRAEQQNSQSGVLQSADVRPAIKIPEPSKFKGSANESENWLYDVESFLRACGIALDSRQAVDVAVRYLSSNALTWWRLRRRDDISNWAQFTDIFLKSFALYDSAEDARHKLDHCRQTSSVRAYVQHFTRYVIDLPEMHEQDKIHRFISGLKPDIRKLVSLQSPGTLSDAIAAASTIDHATFNASFKPFDRASAGGSKHEAAVPMELGSVSHDDKSKKDKKPRRGDKEEVICFRCGQPGHLKKGCRVKLRTTRSSN